MSFDGSLFPCPVCGKNCYPVDDAYDERAALDWVRCGSCKEIWSPMYIRAFWAGYAKKEKEING